MGMTNIARRGFFAIVGAALSTVLIPFKRARPELQRKHDLTWIEGFVRRAKQGGAIPATGPIIRSDLPPGAVLGAFYFLLDKNARGKT